MTTTIIKIGNTYHPINPFNPIELMAFTCWLVWWACKWMLIGTAAATVWLGRVLYHAFDRPGRHRAVQSWYGEDPGWYDKGGILPVTQITRHRE